MKVALVDRDKNVVEVRFMTLPEDLRLVCRGEAPHVLEGDIVGVEYREDKFVLQGTKAECKAVKWLK